LQLSRYAATDTLTHTQPHREVGSTHPEQLSDATSGATTVHLHSVMSTVMSTVEYSDEYSDEYSTYYS
jgi:hypothetical protein